VSLLLQQLAVGVVVSACALFSAWRLSSLTLRLKWLTLLERAPLLARSAWLLRLRQRTLARQLDACGGCAKAPTPDAASPNRTPGALRR
jgi:hypothetical protein